MNSRKFLLLAGAGVLAATSLASCGSDSKEDEYVKGKLKVSIRNLYFGEYEGGDYYIRQIEEKFKIKIKFSSYDWANWNQQVSGAVNGGNLTDVFHANIDSYNFANSYKFWAEEHMIKPLPSDLSRWPNLQSVIENTSNIDALKINGKLYGIPIAKSTSDYDDALFSPFTYVYRRDWAKQWDVYKENDIYTWQEFQDLLTAFKNNLGSGKYALGDVEWGFPSITNFYKQVPHCFAFDPEAGDHGKYVNNYTTAAYIQGLTESKRFYTQGWYNNKQNVAMDGDMNKAYCEGKLGVFYENLSYENYMNIKKAIKENNPAYTADDLAEAAAIMKIKGEDGKYVLEGTDNWFSMTFFDREISTKKQELILDVIDWLLGEEGTRYAIYGEEGTDYNIEQVWNEETQQMEDKIVLDPAAWPEAEDGISASKVNGARYLRYLASLGYDTLSYNPLVDRRTADTLVEWEQEMKDAYVADDPSTPDVNEYERDSQLKILIENPEVRWLTTEKKAAYSGLMRTKALELVMSCVYGSFNENSYKNADTFKSSWPEVLREINNKLGYN